MCFASFAHPESMSAFSENMQFGLNSFPFQCQIVFDAVSRFNSVVIIRKCDKSRRRLFGHTELDTLQAAVAVANLQPQRRRTEQNLRHAGSQLNALRSLSPMCSSRPSMMESVCTSASASMPYLRIR